MGGSATNTWNGTVQGIDDLQAQYTAQFAADKPFVDGADYAHGPVNAPKMDSVLADFDTSLQGLATGNAQAILQRLQKNTQAALGG